MKKQLLVFMCLVSSVLFACSSDPSKTSENPVDTADSGQPGDTTPDADVPDTDTPDSNVDVPDSSNSDDAGTDAPAPVETVQTCLATCETTHPTAAADNHTLDNTCFFGAACGNVCNNLGQGESKFPDATSSASCNTAAAGSYPIGTPSQACSNCLATTPDCCNLWIKIFGSAEGQSLNKCAHDCWTKYPQ